MTLTKRQKEILDFIEDGIRANGYAPTLEEIGTRFGLRSLATVHKHVSNLEAKGLVRRRWNHSRAIELVPHRKKVRNVSEFAIATTTKTVKKLDGSTTAATYRLDSATTPTSITRALMARDVNDIVVLGFGSWSDVNALPTLGFGQAAAVVIDVTQADGYRVADGRPHYRIEDDRPVVGLPLVHLHVPSRSETSSHTGAVWVVK